VLLLLYTHNSNIKNIFYFTNPKTIQSKKKIAYIHPGNLPAKLQKNLSRAFQDTGGDGRTDRENITPIVQLLAR
jgi:hypothetical protein